MEKYINYFLKKDNSHCLYEKFHYDFDYENASEEKFLLEYYKFLGMYSTLFFYKQHLVTRYNSLEIRLKKQDIDHLMKMYKYSKENKYYDEKSILIEFLYTYFKTIKSKIYKQNYIDYNQARKDFQEELEKNNIQEEFFKDFQRECYLFYKRILEEAIEKNIFINNEKIEKILSNIESSREYTNSLIDILINNKLNLYEIIDYDNEVQKHIETYIEYIMEALENINGYNYAKEMIVKVDKKRCLTTDNLKKILNRYIEIENNLIIKLKPKKYSFHQGLDEIDNLKDELNYILNNITSLEKTYKSKIHECLNNLLALKRYLISDDDYVKSEMFERKYTQEIPNEEVEKLRNEISNNNFLLYNYSKIDFIKQVEVALDNYSRFALLSIVKRVTIDSKKQIYETNIEEKTNKKNNNFKLYFDEIGKRYTKENKDLINKLGEDYYKELLKNLKNYFFMQQNLIISMIGRENLSNIFRNLKAGVNYNFNNDYATVVSNVLAIEANIIQIIENKRLEKASDGFSNLNILFESCKENNNWVNGLMYLNYTLYEKSGLNLRNNIMHGNLINTDLTVPLIVSFSGLIFTSWMLNENK